MHQPDCNGGCNVSSPMPAPWCCGGLVATGPASQDSTLFEQGGDHSIPAHRMVQVQGEQPLGRTTQATHQATPACILESR
mmetsp:Transcript_54309/g.116703  ORF Transcript_54309/g.116703 Transcript_54309/m.116703 type:complete len:80 (-) Transcript_54309:827-1066(-)